MIDLIKIIIIPVILYLVGFFTLKRIINVKNWDENSVRTALTINSVWLIVNISLNLLVLNSIGYSLFFNILIYVISIPIGILLLWVFYNRKLQESLIIISLIHVVFFVISSFLEFAQLVYEIFLIEGEGDKLNGAKISFIFAFLFLSGLTIFYTKWGAKIQLIKFRRSFTMISVIPGLYYLIFSFISQSEEFLDNLTTNLLTSFIIAIVFSFLIKKIAYTTIHLQEIRGINVLEKDKSLLRVENLKVHFPLLVGTLKRQVGAVKAVSGVSFEVKTGETLGLVGESGCGKTTVGRCIVRLYEPTEGSVEFNIDGNMIDLPKVPKKGMKTIRKHFQMLFQDVYSSLNSRMKIADIVTEPMAIHDVGNKKERIDRAKELLERVGLSADDISKYPHQFSGGQRQRIGIARSLALNPRLIVCDEPVSALDVSVQAQVLNLLMDLQSDFDLTYIIVSHDLAVLERFCNRIAVMFLGQIMELAPSQRLFTQPQHPYTKALLSAVPIADPTVKTDRQILQGEPPDPAYSPKGCKFCSRCPVVMD
ncbi:hypothetical protein LCGC14_2325140, partial [marine sediment metagenome]